MFQSVVIVFIMFNPFMHPRNPFRARSDFAQLATKYPAFRSVSKCNLDGSVSVNFQDRESVRILSQTLLWDRLALDVQIPANSLVPTLPLRMNYLLWIQDMINENVEYFGSKPIWGLDTGVGACSIYPLLGAQQFHWHFIGTEVDEASLHSAQQNIERNHLDPLIKLILTENAETTPFFATPVAQAPDSHLHFTMCNPPFFEDPSKSPASEDSSETTWPSREKAKSPREYPAGSEGEIQTSGGEVGFVARMIDESVEFQEQIAIFTCMVGHKANLDTLRKKLYAVRSQHALKFIFTEFCQGTRLRWGVAWTFNPAVNDVKVDVVPGAVTSECVTCAISTYKTEWRHQRRRRREEKRQQQEDQGPPSKKIRIEENEASNGGNGEIQLRCSITMIQPNPEHEMAFYVRHSRLPKDEDQTTEFKGHRMLSPEEINPNNVIQVKSKLRRTRQFISKYICGILNTGKGGSMYLGVLDDGVVEGFAMSVFQKDHFKLSLLSCLSNFKPPVASHLFTVKFVPVIESFDDPEAILEKVENFEQRSLKRTSMDREREHTFQVRYCWCDVDALAAFNHGSLLPFYVIEIVIPPWNIMDQKNFEAFGQ
eukprot:TCALIF_12661-PA protein Name:"Similar to Mettl16 Methyltransferase-like protein 16 (Mus musculus)" AED:0.13 eAED:0.16 QI:0/0/0/0.8/0.5/0.8/5/0/596